jgi:type II secretory pathway pseudopilin PulG
MAEEAQPSAERIKAAADEFDRGRRAYLAKDFELAAGHFENAFRDAPSKETLRLAIRARRDAKQLARAATLAAVAQSRYAADAQTAQLAKDTLAETAPALSEYVVSCTAPCTIAADGRVVSQADALEHRVYLDSGAHELGVSFQQGGSVSKRVEGKKGTSTALAFEPAPSPVIAASTTGSVSPAPAGTTSPSSEKPLGPLVFFAAAAVTVAAGAGTVVSGIATQNDPGPDAVRRECAGLGEACPLYQRGQDAETRTNVLLGVTLGAAAVTGVVGLFFTQWSSLARSGQSTRPSSPQNTGQHERKSSFAAGLRLSPFGLSGRF